MHFRAISMATPKDINPFCYWAKGLQAIAGQAIVQPPPPPRASTPFTAPAESLASPS